MTDQDIEKDINMDDHAPTYYVAIGASAGGLEALQEFFHHIPANTGMAFIVIQHLSPDFKSVMAELLSRNTNMDIYNATDSVLVRANTVYLIPPRKNMMIAEGELLLADQMPDKGLNFPIDIFFRCLAEDQHHRSVGVILSGTGSDGSRGILAIKEVGGLVIAQEPSSAKFDGMPYNAVRTGVCDLVVETKEIAAKLIKYTTHPILSGKTESILARIESSDRLLKTIFNLLKDKCDIDFNHYKPTTVIRRIERRIGINGLENIQDYHALLLNSPQELQTLSKDMLIGVTRFFRDDEPFQKLEEKVIPAILEATPAENPVRVWVAGCSTGEEAYSIAILFDEAMKARQISRNIKLFATDVDPDAISDASSGQFNHNIKEDVSEERLRKYFIKSDEHLVIDPKIRKMIVFATHNLTKDPPFSNTNLAICRNVLIYFQPKAQRRILSMLQFSLAMNGYLFLGASESLGDLESYFEVIHDRSRLYQKVVNVRSLSTALPPIDDHSAKIGRAPSVEQLLRNYQQTSKTTQSSPVLEALIEDYSPPCIVLNESHEVLHVYGDVSNYTRSLKSGRFSSLISDFIIDEISIAVSTAIHRAETSQSSIEYENIVFKNGDGQAVSVNLRVRYVKGTPTTSFLLAVLFEKEAELKINNTENVIVYNEADQNQQRIRDLELQLQKNQEHLQVTIEELETTNEELQSSNEELLAANEELQSTNEELQSVNEELYTVNSEYQEKIEELTQANSDLDNIMKSTQVGIVFLDDAMLIRNFTPAATKEIHFLPTDIGRPFHHIAHNLEYDTILKDISDVIENKMKIEKEVKTTTDKHLIISINPYMNEMRITQGCVISINDVTETRIFQNKLTESYDELKATINASFAHPQSPISILVVDDDEVDLEIINRTLGDVENKDIKLLTTTAGDVDSAKALIRDNSYDVCLIDYRLGPHTAIEVLDQFESSAELPAFILLTSHLDDELFQQAIKLGIFDAIDKSDLSAKSLNKSIRYALRHKRTLSYLREKELEA